MKLTGKKLQVWHYPQVPCAPFSVDVKDEYEAMKMINVLADQHCWLFKSKFIPDYTNDFDVVMWDGAEWIAYFNEEEGMDWNDFESIYETELTS